MIGSEPTDIFLHCQSHIDQHDSLCAVNHVLGWNSAENVQHRLTDKIDMKSIPTVKEYVFKFFAHDRLL
jgi:hypothetical protein